MFAFIMLPTKDKAGEVLPMDVQASILAHALAVFCKQAGGCTLYQGSGAWVSSAGNVMTEAVTEVRAFVATLDDASWLRDLADDIKARGNQESVMYGAGEGWHTFC